MIDSSADLQGENWYEKILRAVAPCDLPECGFSEFETYGSFVMTYCPERYGFRIWNSERRGHLFYDMQGIGWRDVLWMGKEYDALSFEKTLHYSTLMKKILKWNISHLLRFTTWLKLITFYDAVRTKERTEKNG